MPVALPSPTQTENLGAASGPTWSAHALSVARPLLRDRGLPSRRWVQSVRNIPETDVLEQE